MANSKKSLQNSASVQSTGKQADRTVAHADSRQPDPKVSPLASALLSFLAQHLPAGSCGGELPPPKLLLALSGGLDSCVLLHLLTEARRHCSFELHAVHVHHGLSNNADDWAAFCEAQCALLDVPLQVVYVNVDKASGLGIEAAARQLRYQALFNHRMRGAEPDFVVTAHHQDDQAETLLLQLFRGAGVKGLSSMAPVDKTRRLLRPLLNVSRLSLSAYAHEYELSWCDDESNDDTQYERNFVRHELVPVLETRYQNVKATLARTASHLAEANTLLDALAEIDAQSLLADNQLCLQGLGQLDLPRAKNLLRWWFAQNQLAMPSTEHLAEMVGQMLNARPDADLNIKLQHMRLKRYQQKAYLTIEQETEPFHLVWTGETAIDLPNGGRLLFNKVTGSGLLLKPDLSKLRITHRSGGERFKPNALRPTRTLKHLLQEANVPPWQRDRLPLIYWHDTLACVPGIGVAHELQAKEQEPGLEIVWQDS